MTLRYLSTTLLLAAALTACDEGDIYPDTATADREGFSVRLTATVEGADSWSGSYRVALAAFAEADEYAVMVKNIDTDTSAATDLTLSGLGPEVKSVELCVLDGLRRRVTTIASLDTDGAAPGTTLLLEADEADAGMLAAIQREVFSTTCANCHGASNHAAADLYLTEGRSRESLVGVASTLIDGAVRVVPGDAAQSVLYQAVATDVSTSWRYDHTVEITSTATLDMIKTWIDGGAR